MTKKKQSIDFQRNKARLGKKQAPSNATDTSFKAKTVALPHQSILVERSGALRTSRGQTLADLRLATNHPNAGSRRDAFQGMLSLLKSHEKLGVAASPAVLAVVIPVAANHLADRDGGVRVAIRALLKWLLPRAISVGRALAPLFDTLLFFIPGALSFDMAVKADSVRTLDTILAHLPSTTRTSLAGGWKRMRLAPPASVGDDAGHAGTLLLGLLNMLGVALPTSALSTASKAGPVGATGTIEVPLGTRVSVLTALRRLFDTVYPGIDPSLPNGGTDESDASTKIGTSPTWFFANDFASPSAWESFSRLLAPLRPSSNAPWISVAQGDDQVFPPLPDSELMDLGATLGSTLGPDQLSAMVQGAARGAPGSTGAETQDTDTAQDLFILLAPTLTAIYVEVAVEAVETLRSIALLPTGAAATKAARTGSEDDGLDAHLDQPLQAVFGITLLVRRLFRSMRLVSDSNSEGRAEAALTTLLTHMGRHFPLSIPSLPSYVPGAQDGGKAYRRNEAALRATNLAYAELCVRAAHFDRKNRSSGSTADSDSTGSRRRAIDSTPEAPSAKRRKGPTGGRAAPGPSSDLATRSVQLQHVSEYLLEVLRQGSNNDALSLHTNTDEAQVDLDALESILPTVWLLLNLPPTDNNKPSEQSLAFELLDALVDRFRSLSASAPSKAPLFAFLARVSMVDRFPAYRGTFHTTQVTNAVGDSPLSNFLREVPRYLWESAMGSSVTRKARIQPVLDYLRMVILDDGHPAFFADDLDALQKMLIPFFTLRNGKCMAQKIDLAPIISAFPPDTLSARLSSTIRAATPSTGPQ